MKIIFQSSFFFFFFGMGVNNFTAISMYGAEFHANEVCQQCDNLNVFKQTKEECTNLLLLRPLQLLGPSFFYWFKNKTEKKNKKVVPEMNLVFFISSRLVPVSCRIKALDPWCSFCSTFYHGNGLVWFLGPRLKLAKYRVPGQWTEGFVEDDKGQLRGCGGGRFDLPRCRLRFWSLGKEAVYLCKHKTFFAFSNFLLMAKEWKRIKFYWFLRH